MNLADKILSLDDRKSREIDIPQWNGKFIVKEIPAKTRENFEVAYQKDPVEASRGLKTSIVVACFYDQDGKKIFTEKHIKALGDKAGTIIDVIFTTAQELSGMTEEAIEETSKNS